MRRGGVLLVLLVALAAPADAWLWQPFTFPPSSGGGVTGLTTCDAGNALADEEVMRADGTTGCQGSTATLTDAGVLSIASGQFNLDNLRLDGNTLSATNTNGDVGITTGASGQVNIDAHNLKVSDDGTNFLFQLSPQYNYLFLASGSHLAWNNATTLNSLSQDTGLARAAAGRVKVTNGSSGAGALDVGNLRLDTNTLSSTDTNGNVVIAPNGTGLIALGGTTSAYAALVSTGSSAVMRLRQANDGGYGIGDAARWRALDSAHSVKVTTDESTGIGFSSAMVIGWANGANAEAAKDTGLARAAAGRVKVTDGSSGAGALDVGNLRLDTNTLSSTDTNGNIVLDPNGSGYVALDGYTAGMSAEANSTLFLYANGVPVVETYGAVNLMIRGTDGQYTFSDGNVGGAHVPDTGLARAAAGRVKVTNGSSGAGALDVGNLRLDTNTLSSTDTNGNVAVTTNGTGDFVFTDGLTNSVTLNQAGVTADCTSHCQMVVDKADAGSYGTLHFYTAGVSKYVVQHDTNDDLIVGRVGGGSITIRDGANDNISITPAGTGVVAVDNLALDGNTLSSTDTNGNINLDPNGTGMLMSGSRMVMLAQFGEISATPDPTTPVQTVAVTGAGTYVEIAPTTALTTGAVDFDQSANGRLRYTGAMTQKFHCAATVSYKGGGAAADVLSLTFGDNGTPLTRAVAYDSATNANLESTALHVAVELAQNEYVSLWMTNHTDTDDPDVHSVNVFCMAAGK